MEEIVTLEVEFYVSTKYVNSEVSEIVEIEFDKEDLENEQYVDDILSEAYEDWLSNNINGGFTIKSRSDE